MEEDKKKRSCAPGCLLLATLFFSTGFLVFKTEIGWTYFYSFGSTQADVEKSLSLRGLKGDVEKARLLVGNRGGYAIVNVSSGDSATLLKPVEESGMSPLGLFSDDPNDSDNWTLLKGQLTGRLPEDLVKEVLASYSLGRCRILSGSSPAGPVDLHLVIHLENRNKCLVIFNYRYG